MPTPPISSDNAVVPIYHDPGHGQESSPPHREADDYICPICGASARDQPIHCISASTDPPSYRSVIEATPSSRLSTLPILNLEIPRPSSGPETPLRALQFDPQGRPHLRFRQNAFSPLSPQPIRSKRSLGLEVPDVSSRPDINPITPGTVEKADEYSSGSSNFAQRIEQRLWRYSTSKNFLKRWLLEIISWLLSAACMAGIIVVLVVYKDKSIPNWPLGLTLNAYISVLSKIATAALLLPVSEALGQLKWSWFNKDKSTKLWDFEIFDNASRGPWGSLHLLMLTKGRTLAALGAIVTIFALATDQFFQQVVEYPEHLHVQPGNGTIPRATGYVPMIPGLEFRRDSGENLVPDQNILGLAKSYIFGNGTTPTPFGKGARAEIPLSCPASQCTWPLYETLGVCSSCVNVADLLEFKCINTTLDWVQVPDENPETYENTFPTGLSCGWWLKAKNHLLMTGYNADHGTNHSGEVLLMRNQPLYDVDSREPLLGYPVRLNHTRNPLAHVVIVSGGSVAGIYRNETPIAHECMMSWCVKEMLSEYIEGSYTEIVNTTTFVNSTIGPNPWTTSQYFNDEGKPAGWSFFYLENITITGPSGVTYEIDNHTHVMTLSLFDDVFPSSYTLFNSTKEADAMMRYKWYVTINPWTRKLNHNPFMFANISTHMDSMATALTNLIRSSTERIEMIAGPAFGKETFVEVRWGWLALPLCLLGLTFLFLIATIIRSSREREDVGIYKTSAIATLLHGLPEDMQKKIKSSKADRTSRVNAKETKIQWIPKGGWRLSGHTFSSSPEKTHSGILTEPR
jgi:hypothetical protein